MVTYTVTFVNNEADFGWETAVNKKKSRKNRKTLLEASAASSFPDNTDLQVETPGSLEISKEKENVPAGVIPTTVDGNFGQTENKPDTEDPIANAVTNTFPQTAPEPKKDERSEECAKVEEATKPAATVPSSSDSETNVNNPPKAKKSKKKRKNAKKTVTSLPPGMTFADGSGPKVEPIKPVTSYHTLEAFVNAYACTDNKADVVKMRLKVEDVKSVMTPGQWWTDSIVDFGLAGVAAQHSNVQALTTVEYQLLSGEYSPASLRELFSSERLNALRAADLVLVPVNAVGIHWSLLTWMPQTGNTIALDSLAMNSQFAMAKAVTRTASQLLGISLDEPQLRNKSPTQFDKVNCGAFTVCNAQLVANAVLKKGLPLSKTDFATIGLLTKVKTGLLSDMEKAWKEDTKKKTTSL